MELPNLVKQRSKLPSMQETLHKRDSQMTCEGHSCKPTQNMSKSSLNLSIAVTRLIHYSIWTKANTTCNVNLQSITSEHSTLLATHAVIVLCSLLSA
jgi:hypothetical protein